MTELTRATPLENLAEIEPLVYTVLGNLPMKELELQEAWEFHPSPQAVQAIVYKQRWVHRATSQIVSESAYVYSTQGVAAVGETGALPG